MMVLALRARGLARVWGPVIGVVCGCVVGAVFGIYDIQRVIDADWIGVPRFSAWPGLDFGALRTHFWLIPSFSFLSLVGAIETVGTAIAIRDQAGRRIRAGLPQERDRGDFVLGRGGLSERMDLPGAAHGPVGAAAGQRKRLTLELNAEAIAAVDRFVVGLASKRGWSEAASP